MPSSRVERKDKRCQSGVGKLSDVARETLLSSTVDEAAAKDRVPMVDEAVVAGRLVPTADKAADCDRIHDR